YTLRFEKSDIGYLHFAVYSLEITESTTNFKPTRNAGSIGILYVNKTGTDKVITLSDTYVQNNAADKSPVINANGEIIEIIGTYTTEQTVTIPKDGALWAPAYLDGPVVGNVNSCNVNVKSFLSVCIRIWMDRCLKRVPNYRCYKGIHQTQMLSPASP
ncbi:MAG: hypothetical protein PHV87_03260, partial [Bacilli bacterium]|nr:hypothetical protein [Bacilli bacterium]